MKPVRVLRYILRKFYFTLAILVIVLAILVQSGRAFSYLVADYRVELANYLAQKMDAKVELAAIEAQWEGLQPVLNVTGITIANHHELQILSLGRMRLRIDLLETLIRRRLVWGNLTVTGARVTLLQDVNGQWELQGCSACLASNADPINTTTIDRLIDVLLLAKRIAFEDTQVDFHFNNGQTFQLASPDLLLENKADFHRLLLRVDMDANKNALFFVAEGTGDPRDTAFKSKAYLQLQEFPVTKLSAATTALAVGRTDTPSIIDEGSVNAAIWFVNESGAGGYNVTGDIAMSGDFLSQYNSAAQLDVEVSSDISGQINHLNEWHINFQQLQTVIANTVLQNTNLSFSRAAFNDATKIHLSRIDLHELSQLLLSHKFLPQGGKLEELVQDLQAEGTLDNIQIMVPPGAPKEWSLTANLTSVSVDSWHHVPAVKNISGYIAANMKGGYVDFNIATGISLEFPDIYQRPLKFDTAKGQVAWALQPDNNKVYINSGLLSISDNDERAQGSFLLSLPWRPGTADIDLTIDVSAHHVKAMQYKKYTPNIVPQFLSEWLQDGVGTENPGIATDVDFIFRGTVSKSPFNAKSFQLSMELLHGNLKYHPDWPAVKNVSASVWIDNTDVFSTVNSGKIFDSNILSTAVSVVDNPDGVGKLLHITGGTEGQAGDGLRILRETMLREYIGDAMDSWTLGGGMQASAKLVIPLESDAKGAYQNVDISIHDATFFIQDHNLKFNQLAGKIIYNSDYGVRSNDLQAELFDHLVDIKLDSELAAAKTLVDVHGVVASSDLAIWAKRPQLFFLAGNMPYDAHIEIYHQPASGLDVINTDSASVEFLPDQMLAAISFKSSLEGVSVNLPVPLAKAPEVKRDLSFSYILGRETSLIDIQYGDLLQSIMYIDSNKNQLLNGAVGLAALAKFPSEPAFHIIGSLPEFDFPTWQTQWDKYQNNIQRFNTQFPNPEKLDDADFLVIPITTDIMIDKQVIGPLTFSDFRIQARQFADSWDFVFSNADIVGEFNWPLDETKPAALALERFLLTPELYADSDSESPEADSSESFNIHDLREANISIENIMIDGDDYGRWTFNVKPSGEQLILSNIHGEIRDLKVMGNEGKGASLYWNVKQSTTRINAVMTAINMNDVLAQWGQPDRIESESAVFNVNLSWLGEPQQFSIVSAVGDVNFLIKEGKFLRGEESSGEGILRLMSLFNFDTLARRLRLDFSDLTGGGLAFDEVTGVVEFERGLLHITEPVALRGASSRMRLTGDIDIKNETLDTQLVASLPISGNLTIITALAAGLPAAAGVWIISKLFAKQVSKMTSVSYTIEGDWDNPVTKFDHMFDSEDKAKAPKTTKSNTEKQASSVSVLESELPD